MAQTIVSNLQALGALASNTINPAEGLVGLPYTAPAALTAAAFDILFDFTLLQQGGKFSSPRSVFVDNSLGTAVINVFVQGSGQQFPIPPYSTGFFRLSASTQASKIEMVCSGGATGAIFIEFYNYDIDPIVWSGFGPTQGNNLPGLLVAGYDPTGLAIHPLNVDSQGRLNVIGSASGGSVFGHDATGVAPTAAPVFVAGITAGGLVQPFLVSNTGVVSSSIVGAPTVQGLEAAGAGATGNGFRMMGADGGALARDLLTDVNGRLVCNINGSVAVTGTFFQATQPISAVALPLPTGAATAAKQPALGTAGASSTDVITVQGIANGTPQNVANVGGTAGTLTTVAASAASVQLLASAATRKGATVFNESTVIAYVALSATAASISAYTVQVAPGGYYEVPNWYTGVVNAIWPSATGNARITSLA